MQRTAAPIIVGFLALSTVSTVGAAEPDAVLVEVAGASIWTSQVRRRLPANPTAPAVKKAIVDAVDDQLLALQAPTVLGDSAPAKADVPELARRVAAAMFAPDKLCQTIPLPMRRQHYDETRWRFVAPPAWTVEDTQLLCCKSPRECRAPKATACIRSQGKRARELARAVASGASQAALKRFGEVYVKRYTFYFDPKAPERKGDWRLQPVDRPIGQAVARLKEGQLTPTPVESRFGHHVIRLLATRPGIDARFDDPRTQALLRTELCPTLLLQQRERTLDDLRQQTPIKLHKQALKQAFGVLGL